MLLREALTHDLNGIVCLLTKCGQLLTALNLLLVETIVQLILCSLEVNLHLLELLLSIVSEALLKQELVIRDEAWLHFNSLTADMLIVQNLQLCQLLLGEHCLDDVLSIGCDDGG